MKDKALSTTALSALRLNIVYLPIDHLKPNPRNPRHHSKRQIKKLSRSIKEFGFLIPVLVDIDRMIIAGHGRVEAARSAGLVEVPTISVEHLTLEQVKIFTIADNALTLQSTWNDQLLATQLLELTVSGIDLDVTLTGLDVPEIDLRIESLDQSDKDKPDPDDDPPPAGPAVTKPSDSWVLGTHTIICADARDGGAYTRILGDSKVRIVFTDPPFNVAIEGHVSGNGSIKHREFAMASGEMTEVQFIEFLTVTLGLAARWSESGAIHFVCMDWRHMRELMAAGREIYTELKNLCIWSKHNAGLGSLYRSQHELIFVFKHGTAPHCNNVELGKHGRNRSNIWQYPSVNWFGKGGEEGNLLALHPTVKPVKLVADALLDCSARGDIVLDPFLGSGTTLIAAERTGRRCVGLEIDPHYTDTIVRRWQAYTGESAVHAVTSIAFDDIAARGGENDR